MTYYSGVPDSELKEETIEIIATDEGEAVGIAVGKHLATGEKQSVYMQPNGFANALEAITSLTIPYKMDIDVRISKGNLMPQHFVISRLIPTILELLKL